MVLTLSFIFLQASDNLLVSYAMPVVVVGLLMSLQTRRSPPTTSSQFRSRSASSPSENSESTVVSPSSSQTDSIVERVRPSTAKLEYC